MGGTEAVPIRQQLEGRLLAPVFAQDIEVLADEFIIVCCFLEVSGVGHGPKLACPGPAAHPKADQIRGMAKGGFQS